MHRPTAELMNRLAEESSLSSASIGVCSASETRAARSPECGPVDDSGQPVGQHREQTLTPVSRNTGATAS